MPRTPIQLALALLLTACAHSTFEVPDQHFPESKTLEQLASHPVAPQANDPAGAPVQLWVLEHPLPTQVGVGPALGDSPGEQLLLELAAVDARFIVDEPLTCAAHQLAHFVQQKNAGPARALLRFMAHRCGVTAAGYRWATSLQSQQPTLADARKLLDQFGLQGHLGLWVVPHGQQWLLVAFTRGAQTTVDPLAMAVEGGQLIISGEVDGAREWILGHVSQGEFGVADCQNLAESGNGFRLACPLRPSDAGTFVDIYACRPGRILGDLEARVWVSPDGSLTRSYEDPSRGHQSAPIPGRLDVALVEALNDVRAQAGARPLTLVEAQSTILTALRPRYRHARAEGDGATVDEIILGLLAGWEVGEPILAAHFSELEFENVADHRQLLSAALAQPGLRASLLDPQASRIALAVDDGDADEVVGGMFTTYTLATTTDRSADRIWLRRLFDLARKSRGLPTLSRLAGADDALAAAGRKLASGKADLDGALEGALQTIAAENPGRQIQGQILITQDVRQVEAPREIVRPGGLALAVHVELVKPANSPWATLVVLIAFAPE